jgi:hypothetical protein
LHDNMSDGRLAQRISAEKSAENSLMSLTIRNPKMEPLEATLFIQNEKLRAARDLLLPRLMSGEIAV